MHKGDHLLLDDGKVDLEVESATPEEIRTRVIDGGELGEHKGINAPHVPLRSDITEKDQRDLKFGLALGVDLVALSFVQSAEDITRVRSIMVAEGRAKVPIVAKLERPEAIEKLDEILDATDAVMVARGDLALEIPLEHVPRVQKQILRKARARGVPVIVATQVLESMRTEPRPTRAEASDAAGAVDGGADAIMLSGRNGDRALSGALRRSAGRDHPRRGIDVHRVQRVRDPRRRWITSRRSARPRCRCRGAPTPMRSSRSRAKGKPRGCCRRCGRWR